jgi:electron transport complex protein RnfE
LVPKNVEIPVYILIISTFVTILELLLKTYINPLYQVLGIYLPLIVVNCIVLGRALSVGTKSNIRTSFKDALGIGLGYTLVLMIISLFREIVGNNTLTIMNNISGLTGYKLIYKIYTPNNLFPISILTKPAGAFLTLAFLIALFNYIKGGRDNESN